MIDPGFWCIRLSPLIDIDNHAIRITFMFWIALPKLILYDKQTNKMSLYLEGGIKKATWIRQRCYLCDCHVPLTSRKDKTVNGLNFINCLINPVNSIMMSSCDGVVPWGWQGTTAGLSLDKLCRMWLLELTLTVDGFMTFFLKDMTELWNGKMAMCMLSVDTLRLGHWSDLKYLVWGMCMCVNFVQEQWKVDFFSCHRTIRGHHTQFRQEPIK